MTTILKTATMAITISSSISVKDWRELSTGKLWGYLIDPACGESCRTHNLLYKTLFLEPKKLTKPFQLLESNTVHR
jgi:hypothetical protein